tara:strand:- start:58 stop:687 length:630 start_codon:yes stop_codon:yes gene_type:complete
MKSNNIPFPDKKYNIIYADPAWSYEDKAKAGNRGASCKYETLSIEDIANLPVKNIASNDCVLFLWVTMPKLNEIWDVIDSWGFQYKTCAFTWIKKNKLQPTFFMGMGSWTRSNAELCLLATKGKPKRQNAGINSIIYKPNAEHSQKPKCVRDQIVKLCGDIPRIELFAREEIEGWDCWGNQTSKYTNKWQQLSMLTKDELANIEQLNIY